MDIRNIDLNLLRALEVLIAERNVTRASQRLNLSQPALSAQLNRLRDLFDDPLLIPAQRGMIPTERALELQGPLQIALENVRVLLTEYRSFDPATCDLTFSIGASDYVQSALLCPLTETVLQEAPHVRLAWYPVCGRPVYEQIERGEIHLWVRPSKGPVAPLIEKTLFSEEFVCIARAGHPRVDGSLDLDAFIACEHVIVSPGGGGFSGAADDALRREGLERRVVLSVASVLMALDVVAQTDYLAVVPARVVRRARPGLQALQLPFKLDDIQVSMLWHPRTQSHPAHNWLRDKLLQLPFA